MPKRLFVKLLLGFWLITVLIAGTIVALPALIESTQTIAPIQLERHHRVVELLANSPSLAKGITRAQRLFGPREVPTFKHRGGRFNNVFVVDQDNLPINRRKLPNDINFAIVKHQEEPHHTSFHFKRWSVFGPYQFTHQQSTYQLYLREGEHNRRMNFLSSLRDNRWLLLFMVMVVSAVCCGLLAWHITRPINSLDKSAKRLARGDLSVRAEDVALRHRDEIGQLAQSFNDMASSVESMVQNQQRLLGDISHELRTPLTRLQLACAISRRKIGESEELSRIEQETQTIDGMLQQLLSLSRYQMTNDQPFESVDFDQFIDDILENAIFEAKENGIELSSDITPNLRLNLQWDPLASAIENIIRNAIRYATTRVTLSAIQEEDSIIINICDDGCGVAPEHLSHLFSPFYRVSSARERDSGGTGLGLAIAHKAITRHQGTIEAVNNNLGGLSIIIALPSAI